MFSKISFKGIIAGFILGQVLGVIATMLAAWICGVPLTKLDQYQDTKFLIADFLFDLPCYFIGGYIAARLAKQNQLMNASIVGAIWVVLNILASLAQARQPIWYIASWLLSSVPMAYLGGKIAIKQKKP
jgi:hypothetical protein